MVKKKKLGDPIGTAYDEVLAIKKALGYQTFEQPPRMWLDLGNPLLNSVLGSEDKGVAYGKCIAIAGIQSAGKTLLAAKIAGLAQQDGADVAWWDLEDSFDKSWVFIHGLRAGKPIRNTAGEIVGYSRIAYFHPEWGKYPRHKLLGSEPRMSTAEEQAQQVTDWMRRRHKINPKGKLCVVVDSTTAAVPAEEMAGDFTDQNMRTKLLAPFLNQLTKTWMSMAPAMNALVIYVSQLRVNPGQMFGNPEYMPGGKGIYFFPHVICTMRRVKNGEILQNGVQVGVKSILTNIKNKTGGGSVEHLKCGMKAYFNKPVWKFSTVKEIKGEA